VLRSCPTILSASLANTPEAGGDYLLTLTGIGITPSSIVKWNTTTLTTTYISPWQLSASDDSKRPAQLTVGTSQSFEVQ
jgi:hypothetical protein